MLRDAKRKYYDAKFKDALNNARTTWKVINEILNKNKDKVVIDEIEFEGKSIKNKTEICNLFNDFFLAQSAKKSMTMCVIQGVSLLKNFYVEMFVTLYFLALLLSLK